MKTNQRPRRKNLANILAGASLLGLGAAIGLSNVDSYSQKQESHRVVLAGAVLAIIAGSYLLSRNYKNYD